MSASINWTKMCLACLMFSLASSLCPSALRAQGGVTGEITGVVLDTTGAVVPNAMASATNVLTNVRTETVTNDTGLYRILRLIPGTYSVSVERTGFKKFIRENVVVSVDTVVRVDATLDVGVVTEVVAVTGAAPMLKTDTADVSQSLGRQALEDLPVVGRNITRLVQLAPGAVMNSSQLTGWPENAGEDFRTNINGQKDGNSNRELDGVDNNETIQGLSMIVPSLDSVQEMKVTTSSYDAEFGQVAAAVIQVSTKSGTNDLHGSLFEFYRSSGLYARNPFTEPNGPAKFVWHQFGGSLGGPIVKDKLFFFGDYQGMRSRNGASRLTTVPVEEFRNGDFSAVAATHPIFDPTTGNPDGTGRAQFSDPSRATAANPLGLNIIPMNRISPAATNLLALLPPPTDPTKTDNNFTTSGGGAFSQNQFATRIDYNPGSETRLFGRYSFFRGSFDIPAAFGDLAGGLPLGGNITSGFQGTQTQSSVANYTRIFSPTLLTDLRFAIARVSMHNTPRNAAYKTAEDAGLPGINISEDAGGIPQFSVPGPVGAFTFGQNLPFLEYETSVNVANNWTKIIGGHSLKWGADIKKAFLRRQDSSLTGSMGFSQNLTGSADVPGSGLGTASFLLGLPSSFSRIIYQGIRQEKQWRDGFYFQDRWTVNSKLTLSLGIRWEYFSPIFAQNPGDISNLDTDTGEVLIGGLYDKYAGVEPVYDEFAPRVGLAYRLRKGTVIRAGFGRGYSIETSGANFGRMFRNWPVTQSQTDSAPSPWEEAFTFVQGPPAPPVIPPFPDSGTLPMPDGNFYILYPGPGPYPHTRVDSWNVTIQHELRPDTTLEIAYVGNVGRNLWGAVASNAAIPGPGPYNPRRPFFNEFGWTQYLQLFRAMGQNDYHALQTRFHKSFSNGFYVLSTFTWSKALDEQGAQYLFQNQLDLRSNRGPSELNREFVSQNSFLWELPFGPGKPVGSSASGVARHVIQGWSINGIVTLMSGIPFTPLYADTSSFNSDCCTLRPDRIGSGEVSNPTREAWFDPTAFARPPDYTYGNSGRNILTGPGWATADLSLSKAFQITEKVNLEFRWEAFNAFNRTNLANPAPYVDTATAGRITNILYNMRQMQFGARLEW